MCGTSTSRDAQYSQHTDLVCSGERYRRDLPPAARGTACGTACLLPSHPADTAPPLRCSQLQRTSDVTCLHLLRLDAVRNMPFTPYSPCSPYSN
jgi:hypothetical protein